MIKSITKFLIILSIFQQLQSQISQIDKNRDNPFSAAWNYSLYKLTPHPRLCLFPILFLGRSSGSPFRERVFPISEREMGRKSRPS